MAPPCVLDQPTGAATGEAGDRFLERPRWSPCLVGTGIGVLSWFTFLLSAKAIGVSTAYARTAGMIRRVFAVSSWLAAICFFVGGVATARLIYHVLS